MGELKYKVRPKVLQEVKLITNTPAQCYKRYFYLNPEMPISIPVWLGYGSCTVDGFEFTYPDTGDRSTCIGDSGGPTFWEDFNDKQRAYMIG